ncbi:hypothetical protein Tco_0636034 [Tanacetum coccineum]
MRNKSNLDTMSMDDLYNNLKVYEAEIKSQSSLSSKSQNVAFVSSENTSSTNEVVNTAHEVSTASSQGQAYSLTYADDVMFSFFVNQSNSPQLDNEDLEQIDTDDLEEMDLKWESGNRKWEISKKNCTSIDFLQFLRLYQDGIIHQALMLRYKITRKRKACLKSYESLKEHFDKQKEQLKKSNLEIIGYQLGLESLEARIVVHQKNEAVYEEDIAFLKYDVKVRDNSITELKNQLAEALREKDDLKLKLEKFETSSKNLTDLLNSQISVNNKTGIGFDSQMTENELHDIHKNNSEVFESASDSSVNEIEEENNQVNDRFKKVEGYHAVPPPYTGNYMPSRPDLSFAGLDDSVYKTNVSETITSVPRNESTASKSSKDNLEQPKDVRPSAPIVEEWESDSDDDCVTRPSIEQNKPSYAKINFVKSNENTRKSVIEQNTYRQAENLRKSQSPRVDKRNWNGLMTQKLGDGFEFNKKACFVCGSLNHLIKDCNFYENKMVGKSMLNNMGRVTGQREVRPVWNNAQRVNHQNKLTHPHPKRNFVPTAVLTRYVNTDASRPTVNGAKPSSNVFHKLHSSVKRTIYQRTTPKNSDFKEKINTAKVNNVTTVGTKAVVSAVQGHEKNVVKSSACSIWRPIGKDKGIFDSGCSRHMTRNKFYLSDYQDINGGFVAFVGSPKGDHLGKFKGKADERFLVGYSVNRSGPEGLFDIDLLTKSMNYEPVSAGNQTNNDAGIETNVNAVQTGQEKASNHDILLPFFTLISQRWLVLQKEGHANSTNIDSTASPSVSTAGPSINTASENINTGSPNINTASPISNDSKADLNNLETTMNVSLIPTTRIHKDHPKDQIIGDINLAIQTRRMINFSEENAMIEAIQEELLQFKLQKVWTLVDFSKGKRAIGTKSMIESLMYLTASRPDITFAVCACARFQVTPKTSHLYAVKRIFRYLKGQLKLGLWYASLDNKFTTGGCQFLGKKLISWQCLWIQNQMLDYGFNFMNTKIYIDNESTICIVKNLVFYSKTKHIEIRHHFIRDSYEKKLIQVIKIHTDHNVAYLLINAFDVRQLIIHIEALFEGMLYETMCISAADYTSCDLRMECKISMVMNLDKSSNDT